MKSRIQFVDEKIKNAFKILEDEDPKLHSFILRAFRDIEDNVFCGIQIPKRLIPDYYIKKYNIKNLWKYNLPDAWRLIYSVKGKDLLVFSIILEWMDHKTYERRFKY